MKYQLRVSGKGRLKKLRKESVKLTEEFKIKQIKP
jgi:hypothetical protein